MAGFLSQGGAVDWCDLAATGVQGLAPYQPGKPIEEVAREIGLRPEEIVKLASNENPLGPSPKAVEAALGALSEIHRYPDGSGFRLKQKLSERLGVRPEQITLGNGSNDVLDLIARVFLGPGKSAVFSEHAFAVYPISTQAVGADAKIVAEKDYRQDLDGFLQAIDERTHVVFIANPNNPTGTYVTSRELDRFLERVPAEVVVVLDEAYFEYVDLPDHPNGLERLSRFPNLVITRTFSKIYGLAGLRVGYAISSPEIADLLNRVRHPFNVNSLALTAAEAALDDEDFLKKSRALNQKGLRQLEEGLKELGFDFIPSVGNFLTFDTGRDAQEMFTKLLKRGVIVRPVANYHLPRHLRVSVGLPEENDRFLQALAELV